MESRDPYLAALGQKVIPVCPADWLRQWRQAQQPGGGEQLFPPPRHQYRSPATPNIASGAQQLQNRASGHQGAPYTNMKCQRNLVQSKIVNTTPKKDLNDMDLVTLPEREFKIKIINILMEVRKDIQELRN